MSRAAARPETAPLVGVTACARDIAPHRFHVAGEKYVTAVADGARAVPVLLPPLGERGGGAELIRRLDGLLVTGSASNVEPHRYGGAPSRPGTLHDPDRDDTTLPLIRAALAAGVPLLAICRGIQELNVALGGTLHQLVHELPGRLDHREDKSRPLEVQYGPAHPVRIAPGGVLAALLGRAEIVVNSVHSQGIDRLAERLEVEATAPDGQVEAVRVRDARGFALGVQWHPEWRVLEDASSRALFAAFGDACRAYARARVAA